MWTLPNILTLLRIILIPVFIIVFYWKFPGHRWTTAIIFLLAAATDWLDGYLARTLKQDSPFGAFLDPVADKLIVAAALVMLVSEFAYWWVALAGIVVISREIVISALREWMAEVGKRAAVKVSFIGKAKTTMQMIAVFVLLTQPNAKTGWVIFGFVLLYVAVILTLWSMCKYLIAAFKVLR